MGAFLTPDVFDVEAVNPLAGLPTLAGKVAIYVPTTQDGRPASSQVIGYQREKVAESLARWFGGFTEVQGDGGWYSEKLGRLVRERVFIIAAAAPANRLRSYLASLVNLARQVAKAMEQECVALEVNGTMYFVSPAEAEADAPAYAATA